LERGAREARGTVHDGEELMIIPLRCRCGESHGSIDFTPNSGMRLVCYCDDCRAFARALDRTDILDDVGGTEIFVTTPSRLALTSGVERLRCLRLSTDGMLRWYWGCCNTPLANTTHQSGVPVVSIHRAFIDLDDTTVLGAVTRLNARFALGPVAAGAQQSTSLVTMAKMVIFMLVGRLRGEHKPNPLFSDDKPILEPRILVAAERDAVRQSIDG
jgi:hypothetical protein